MKTNPLIPTLLLILCLPLYALGQGIQFETGNFRDVLEKASRTGKMVFIDVYTSWCGPCKTMSGKVFTDPRAGKFYNQHFVCYKLDAEKGEGPVLAKQLKVNCYPTLIYLTPKQEIKHRFSGQTTVEEFIQRGKTALDSQRNLTALQKAYAEGNRNPVLTLQYLKLLKEAYLPYNEIADDFFNSLPGETITQPTYREILRDYLISMNNPAFRYILSHQQELADDTGFINDLLTRCIEGSISAALKNKDYTIYDQCCQELSDSHWSGKDKLMLWAEKEYYKSTEDWDNYFNRAITWLEIYAPENWIETWRFARDISEERIPFREGIAIPYAKRAVKLMPNYSTFLTYARLLYKTGNPKYKPEIIEYTNKAIQYEESRQTGRDLAPEREFLARAATMDYDCNPLPPYILTVQPIVARADDGTWPASMALPIEMVNRVYEKTNVQFYFLPPLYWDCTDVRDGKINLDSICRQATREHLFKGNGDIVNMVFVNRVDGHEGPLGRGLFNGNVTFIALGENGGSQEKKALQTFVIAHEIGHNFGLQHAIDDPHVPDTIPNIMGDGAFSDRIDPFFSLNPYQTDIVHRSPLVRERIDFLNRTEGQKAILDETFEPYFSQLQRREIMAFTGEQKIPDNLTDARDYIRNVFREAVLEFTPQEKEGLTRIINKIITTLQSHQLSLLAEHPWRFIKIRENICGGFAHTRGNCIILSEKHLSNLTEHPAELPQLTLRLGKLIVHEQLHVLQRTHPAKFQQLNTRYWNFVQAYPPTNQDLQENQVSNPDAPKAEWLIHTPDNRYYWPRVLFNEQVEYPQMGKDFVEYAYLIQKDRNRFTLTHSRRPQRILLSGLPEYTTAFPVKTGIDHPYEIAAYMFADYFGALWQDTIPFAHIAPAAQANTRKFLEWCTAEMSGDTLRETVSSLMSRLTLRDKINMIGGDGSFQIKGIPEAGIPAVSMADGPQGIKDHGDATAFPSPICMAATWNPALIRFAGAAIAREGKAKGIGFLLAPGVNMYRVPQCGRNFEYMGEDPCLASRIAVGYIQGVQSGGMIATVKHFAANNQDFDRHSYSSDIDNRTLHEIYFPAFKAAIQEGQAQAIMTSYNPLNGIHTSESAYLLQDILRKEWHFKGIAMSDWISVYSPQAVNAGLDLEMPSGQFMNPDTLLPLIRQNRISPGTIDTKVSRIIRTCARMNLYALPPVTVTVNFKQHDTLARQIAEEGIVLLKNNGLLPLSKEKQHIAIIAPGTFPYSGGGAAKVTPVVPPRLFHQLNKEYPGRFTHLDVTHGYDTTLLHQIEKYDAVIVLLGFNDQTEGEGFDRPFRLPQEQNIFMDQLCRRTSHIIVLLTAGGGVDIPWNGKVNALLHCWYPGQAGDKALAAILLGSANPSGKLPISIEKKWSDNAAAATYDTTHAQPGVKPLYTLYGKPHKIKYLSYEEGIFTGYRHYDAHNIAPLYPFGFGLSYSTFKLSCLKLSTPQISREDTLYVWVKIKNTGKYKGKETVQLYIEDVNSSLPRPPRELKAFQKIELAPGQSDRVRFCISPQELSFYHPDKKQWQAEPGEFILHIGTSSRNLPLHEAIRLE